jgi:hypothetical protein
MVQDVSKDMFFHTLCRQIEGLTFSLSRVHFIAADSWKKKKKLLSVKG